MINKSASFSFTSIDKVESYEGGFIRTASSKKGIENEARNVIVAEMKKHKNALFFRAKAIEADIPNNNGDSFSASELKKSYQTFVGVPFFTNHDNQNIERAKGKIVWAEWIEDEKSVYVVAFVDRDAYPNLCRGIEQEYMTGVSMGASVGYSECSLCGNRASTVDEYCSHIKNFKGRKFTGSVKNVRTGKTREVKAELVFEHNYDLRFIELSGVADPACTSCRIDQIYDGSEFGQCGCEDKAAGSYESLVKAASTCYNNISVVRTASLEKNASQQDVEQLNQCLTTIEQVSVKLIQNRANVEMEFASDLVEILASLQDFVDQLVQAGYGQLPESSGQPVPGVSPDQSAPPAPAPAPGAPATQPVSQEADIAGTTNTEKPIVEPPSAPSALSDFKEATRPAAKSQLTRPIKPKKSQTEDEMRRMPIKSASDRERTKEVLDGNWQEKLKIFSNNLTEAINKDLTTSGGQAMSKGMNVEAKAKGADLHETNEAQLESSRTGKEADVVMEKQLEKERDGKDISDITEKQLEKGDLSRTGKSTEVITEKQLDKGDLPRTGKEADAVMESQLEVDRVGKEQDVVTEKQLSKTPWARSASSIQKHVEASTDILAKVVVASGSTPEQVMKAACSFSGGTSSTKLAFAYEMWNDNSKSEDIVTLASRNGYWGKKGVKSQSSMTIRDALVSYASEAIKAGELNPECLVECFHAVVANSASHMVEEKVNQIIAKASVPTENLEPSMTEQINSFFSAKTQLEEAKTIASDIKSNKVVAADHMIEATAAEVGLTGKESKEDRNIIASKFARAACKQSGLKFASLVNVTVDGETITIAVETDGGESVEIPIGDKSSVKEDTSLDTDLGGDAGVEDMAAPAPTPAPEAPAPAPAAPALGAASTPGASAPGKTSVDDILGMAATKKKVKTAQFGGGAPGVPNAGGGVAAPEDTSAMAPEAMPEEGGVQTLTDDVSEEEDIPGDEQKMAGTICPICGADDTETGRKDQNAGQFDCNNCGAKYIMHVNVDILNPEELFNNAKKEDGMEEPELPEMPVAAAVKVDKQVFGRVVKAFSEGKVACPGCGREQAAEGEPSSHVTKCASCGTHCQRDLIIDTNSPENVQMRVEWNLKPSKRKCASCNKARKAFATDIAFGRMIKSASKAQFPVASAKAWVAKNYGKDAVVSYGPFKGEKLADTVVKQLSTFGLDKVKHMKRLCEVQTKADPMDECVKLQKRQSGLSEERAKHVCACIKERFKTEEDENLYMEAFAGMFSKGVMRRMAGYVAPSKAVKTANEEKQISDDETNIADLKVEDGVATAKTEKKAKACDEVKVKTDKLKTKKIVQKLLQDEAKIPSGKAMMGEEKDTTPADKAPEIPKAKNDGYLGNEKEAAPKSTDEVVIPVKVQYLGEEEKKGDINTSITGNIATSSTSTGSDGITVVVTAGDSIGEAKPISECDCVSRGKATMGDEKPVEEKAPVVPSKGDGAMMGDEKSSIPSGEEATAPHKDAEKVEVTTRVTANLEEHRSKIATARRDKAIKIAATMLGNGSIVESEYDDMVDLLSTMPLDKQEKMASKMNSGKTVKTASTLTTPVVIEDKGMPENKNQAQSLTEKIASHFTIGSRQSDKYIKSGELE
jgi:hypothetical protein